MLLVVMHCLWWNCICGVICFVGYKLWVDVIVVQCVAYGGLELDVLLLGYVSV